MDSRLHLLGLFLGFGDYRFLVVLVVVVLVILIVKVEFGRVRKMSLADLAVSFC